MTQKLPLVSVIIPVYNRARELKQTLQSVFAQTYKNIEVIVVDDGSTEPVSAVVQEFQKEQQNLLFQQQKNAGAPVARNNGFLSSKGDYVIFWDADIIAEPQMLEKMMVVMQKNSDVTYVYSSFYFGFKKMPALEFNADKLKENNFIPMTSLLRRADFPGFDVNLKKFQDWDVWLTLLEQGKRGVRVPEFLFRVIPHSAGMSAWLPKFLYKKPWKYLPFVRARVSAYEASKHIIQTKHKQLFIKE